MIVVDANVVAYLLLEDVRQVHPARRLLERDPEWWAPMLLRSELRQALIGHVRHGLLSLAGAVEAERAAELLLAGRERPVDSARVLEPASASSCSAYDCEYVALAEELGTRLVTADRRLATAFPAVAVPLDLYA